MAKVIDLGVRRELQQHRRKDARATEMKEALRTARTGQADGGDSGCKVTAAHKLLNLYKRKKPPEIR